MLKYFFSISTLLVLFFLLSILANAQEMESSLYKLEENSVSVSSNQAQEGKNRVEIVDKKDLPTFNSRGFVVKNTTRKENDFTLSLSDSSILWEELKPHTLNNRNVIIVVTARGFERYRIYGFEEKKLTSFTGDSFPDVRCNSLVPCNEKRAQSWTNVSEYGFGYNLGGQDIGSDFKSKSSFRPFPDSNEGKKPAMLLQNTDPLVKGSTQSRKATLTFQVVASDIQSKQAYQGIVHLLAVPGY